MASVQILSPEIDVFADINQALDNPDGLLAIGGDLSTRRLLAAYGNGIFPWYEQGQPIMWWSPSTRAVIYPGHYRPNRSLTKVLRQNRFDLAWNKDFLAIVEHCQAPRPNQEGTWITEEMKAAYLELYHQGHAHSLACYEHGKTRRRTLRRLRGRHLLRRVDVFPGQQCFKSRVRFFDPLR